jgi:DNA-binding MarR family transcriptional regulator
MVNEQLFGVFFREKPAKLLLCLRNARKEIYASTVAKQIDCTYSHVVKILQEMEAGKLITFNKTGRLKLLTLTKRGEQIADYIERIRGVL